MVNYLELARKAALEYRNQAAQSAPNADTRHYEFNEFNEKRGTGTAQPSQRRYEKSESNEISPPVWWRIIRDGEPLCIVMRPDGLTRDDALEGAQAKWPNHTIEVTR